MKECITIGGMIACIRILIAAADVVSRAIRRSCPTYLFLHQAQVAKYSLLSQPPMAATMANALIARSGRPHFEFVEKNKACPINVVCGMAVEVPIEPGGGARPFNDEIV